MDLDNFIIGKTKERRGEERGDLAKKQQLLSKHRAAADDKNSQKIAVAHWSYAPKLHIGQRKI